MSRIYRSLDVEPSRASPLDFQRKTFGDPHSQRPRGGFQASGQPEPEPEPVIPPDVQAREEARRLLEDARNQAEAIQRDAYHAGFEEGEKAGRKLAEQKNEPKLQSLAELIEAAARDRERLIRLHESELIKIAFGIATRILARTVELDSETIQHVVTAALAKVGKSQAVTLTVSPLDLPLLRDYLDQSPRLAIPGDHITLQADETIGRGGCRLSTDTGEIDAALDAQLDVLRRVLW